MNLLYTYPILSELAFVQITSTMAQQVATHVRGAMALHGLCLRLAFFLVVLSLPVDDAIELFVFGRGLAILALSWASIPLPGA